MKLSGRKTTISLIFVFLLFIFFVLYDYYKFNEFNWFENFLRSLFTLIFFRIMSWLFESKKNKSEN
jgi:uncharacterized BrkB/YihY/UPF0761 family membrane protein